MDSSSNAGIGISINQLLNGSDIAMPPYHKITYIIDYALTDASEVTVVA